MIQRMAALLALVLLAGCGEPVTSNSGSRILLLGDSLMAFNKAQDRAVSDAIEEELNAPGWSEADIDAMTEIYEEDMHHVARIPGVTFIAP